MIKRTFEHLANKNWLSCHPLNTKLFFIAHYHVANMNSYQKNEKKNLPIFFFELASSTIWFAEAKGKRPIFGYQMIEWHLIYSMSFWFAHFKWSAIFKLETKRSNFLGKKWIPNASWLWIILFQLLTSLSSMKNWWYPTKNLSDQIVIITTINCRRRKYKDSHLKDSYCKIVQFGFITGYSMYSFPYHQE